jgi:hypothetical protein
MLRRKISGAHSHFDENLSLPGQEAVPTGISMELVVPIVKFWKVNFLHFLNPEDGGTKPLRSVTLYRSTWFHKPKASIIQKKISVRRTPQIKLLKLAFLTDTMSAGTKPTRQQQHSIGYLERIWEDIKGKESSKQARCVSEGSRSFRLPYFMTFGT